MPRDSSALEAPQPVLNASDNQVFVTVNDIERESFSYYLPSIYGPKHLLGSVCIRLLTRTSSLGLPRANPSRQKQRRLPYRWHVSTKALETQCWTPYENRRCDCSRY